MKREITLAARTAVVRIFGLVLFGMISGLPLHSDGFKSIPIDHPKLFAEKREAHGFLLREGKSQAITPPRSILALASSINVRDDSVGLHLDAQIAQAERHDYTKGDVPGLMSQRPQKLKADLMARTGQYSYRQIDVAGAVFTGVFAINSRGQTVGFYVDGSNTSHGFLRNVDGSITTIDYPGATFIGVNGINSQGDVVGRWDDASGISHAFVRTSQGSITSFDPAAPCIAATTAAAHGINDLRDIVGRCFDASGRELGWLLRHDGSFAILDDPNFLSADTWALDNRRMVVGDYSDASGFVHGYTWTEAGGFTTLDFENNMTGVRAINQRGDISGIFFDGLTLHGFLRPNNGTDVTIDPPGSVETDSAVVNDTGMIAGTYLDAGFNGHGYIAMPSATAAREINKKLELAGRWGSQQHSLENRVLNPMPWLPRDSR